MLRKLTVTLFACAVLLAPMALAQEDLTVSVNEMKSTIDLGAGGQTFQVLLNKGALSIKVNKIGYLSRFSVAENLGATDWLRLTMIGADVTKDTAEEKEVVARYNAFYQKDEAAAKTERARRAAAGEPTVDLNLEVKLTVSVKKGLPCVFATHEVINNGETLTIYSLPWTAGGPAYYLPGEAGPEKKEWKRKYATVSKGTAPWAFTQISDNQGLGMIFPEYQKVFIGEYGSPKSAGGSLYMNTIPQKPKLEKGQSFTFKVIYTEAASAEEVLALYEKVK